MTNTSPTTLFARTKGALSIAVDARGTSMSLPLTSTRSGWTAMPPWSRIRLRRRTVVRLALAVLVLITMVAVSRLAAPWSGSDDGLSVANDMRESLPLRRPVKRRRASRAKRADPTRRRVAPGPGAIPWEDVDTGQLVAAALAQVSEEITTEAETRRPQLSPAVPAATAHARAPGLLAIPVGSKSRANFAPLLAQFRRDAFDCIVFHYEPADTDDTAQWAADVPHYTDCVSVRVPGQTKFWFAKRFLTPDTLGTAYDYLFLWDDDAALPTPDWSALSMVHVLQRYHIHVAQPALLSGVPNKPQAHLVKWHAPTGDPVPSPARFTNFVEVMFPIYSTAAWRTCAWSALPYDGRSYWGTDNAMYPLCVSRGYCRFAVVDVLPVHHRDARRLAQDTGTNIREMFEYLNRVWRAVCHAPKDAPPEVAQICAYFTRRGPGSGPLAFRTVRDVVPVLDSVSLACPDAAYWPEKATSPPWLPPYAVSSPSTDEAAHHAQAHDLKLLGIVATAVLARAPGLKALRALAVEDAPNGPDERMDLFNRTRVPVWRALFDGHKLGNIMTKFDFQTGPLWTLVAAAKVIESLPANVALSHLSMFSTLPEVLCNLKPIGPVLLPGVDSLELAPLLPTPGPALGRDVLGLFPNLRRLYLHMPAIAVPHFAALAQVSTLRELVVTGEIRAGIFSQDDEETADALAEPADAIVERTLNLSTLTLNVYTSQSLFIEKASMVVAWFLRRVYAAKAVSFSGAMDIAFPTGMAHLGVEGLTFQRVVVKPENIAEHGRTLRSLTLDRCQLTSPTAESRLGGVAPIQLNHLESLTLHQIETMDDPSTMAWILDATALTVREVALSSVPDLSMEAAAKTLKSIRHPCRIVLKDVAILLRDTDVPDHLTVVRAVDRSGVRDDFAPVMPSDVEEVDTGVVVVVAANGGVGWLGEQ
ncbi:hypothetical protein GGF31_000421 [Allomyces arbusculus]|nr:hypothetical protein GGF31_000421 [Allomyces arbusculus]